MKYTVLIATVFLLSACTSLSSYDSFPETQQLQVVSGDLIRSGDKVQITTTDGKIYNFMVHEVTDTQVTGYNQTVLISDIAQLEVRRPSFFKSVALAGGVLVGAVAINAIRNDNSMIFDFR